MSTKDFNLAALRKKARLTQADLAQSLRITQARVSKYEANGEIPTNLLRGWARAIGCTIDELIEPPSEDEAEEKIFDFNSSLYGDLTEDLNLLLQYIDRFPHLVEGPRDESISPTVEQFSDRVTSLKEKPWVVLTGHFDAGKSHLCNFYLGGDQLPTGYRPVTRYPTFVRHTSDQPEWFKEDLWLMGPDFDPERWNEEKYCTDNRVLAGSWDTLRTKGHLKGEKDISDEGFVLAFIKAPLLHSCVLVDLPGYDDNKMTRENDSVIDRLGRRADVLLYLCPAQGFLDSGDFGRLSHLLRSIPHYEAIDKNFPILGNLFIIASHAHPGIKEFQIKDEILKGGSKDFYKHFEENLFSELSSHHERSISSEDVGARFFSFYEEEPKRRKELEQDLKGLLGKQMPSIKKKIAKEEILKFKEHGTAIYTQAIGKYEKILLDEQEAKRRYEWLEKEEPERKKNHKKQVDRIKKKIATFEEKDLKNIRAVFEEETRVKKLEAMIKQRYKYNKKGAHRYASAYVFEKIQSRTTSLREELMEEIQKLVEEFVQSCDMQIKKLGNVNIEEEFSTSFDAKEVSSLYALNNPFVDGTGSFSVFNSVLIGSITSAARGSIASAMGSLLRVRGSVLAFGVLLVAGVSLQILFGDSWQLRLAKKIKGLFDEENVLSRIEEISKSFWKETLTAFNTGADSLDEQHKDYIKDLKIAFEGSKEGLQDLKEKVESYEKIKSFFSSLGDFEFQTERR